MYSNNYDPVNLSDFPLEKYIIDDNYDGFKQKLAFINKRKLREELNKVYFCICKNDRIEMVYYLQKEYSHYITYNKLFYTAVFYGAINIVKYLVSLNIYPSLNDPNVIKEASISNSIEMLKYCIKFGWVVTDLALMFQVTPYNEEFEIEKIKILIDNGIDINVKFNYDLDQPKEFSYLKRSICFGRINLVKVLLDLDVTIDMDHLIASIHNYDIFLLVHNRGAWLIGELIQILKISALKGFPLVLKFLLINYPFDNKIIEETWNECLDSFLTPTLAKDKAKEILNILVLYLKHN